MISQERKRSVIHGVARYSFEMPAQRTARRKTPKKDPIERRLYLRQRREEAPQGFLTRRTLCERVGLTDSQIRALASSSIIESDGLNSHGYALYSNATAERLAAMKRDGTLFRTITPNGSEIDLTATSTSESRITSPTLRYSAEDGVRVFELLGEGKSLEVVVRETRIHPLIVKAIRIDYDDLTGSIHLSKHVVDRLNEFGTQGKLSGGFPLRDDADVLAVVELCAIDRTCSSCEKNPALSSCEDCLAKERRAALSGMSQRSA